MTCVFCANYLHKLKKVEAKCLRTVYKNWKMKTNPTLVLVHTFQTYIIDHRAKPGTKQTLRRCGLTAIMPLRDLIGCTSQQQIYQPRHLHAPNARSAHSAVCCVRATESQRHRQKDRQTDRQKKQTDRQTDHHSGLRLCR